jgi:hypothetical protein
MSDREFLLERMEKHLRHRGEITPPDRAAAPDPSLTISRQCGAGLHRLERPLLEYLDNNDQSASRRNWALFDQSFIGRLIEENRLPRHPAPFFVDHAKFPVPSELVERLNHPEGEWTFFNHSAAAIRKLCTRGNALIVGRAGNFVTADLPNTFHVRLVGAKDKRIGLTAKRYGMPLSEATELVDETDKSRAKFVRRYAGGEIDDAGYYHLVINTDNLPDALIVRLIGDALVDWSEQQKRTGEFPPLVGLPRPGSSERSQ